MIRYYVEFDSKAFNGYRYLYVNAYSEQQVRDIFDEYEILCIDQTD